MVEPFFIHLTVFKSRVAIANIVLPACSLRQQALARTTRKTVEVLQETESVRPDDPKRARVFEYLVDEKKLIGKTFRQKGRYPNYWLRAERKNTVSDGAREWVAEHKRTGAVDELKIFRIDIWMSDLSLPSTVGAPTPENVTETIEACHQFGLLSKARNTLTTAGYAATRLREERHETNPFVLGLEAVVYWRQLFMLDGPVIFEVLRVAAENSGTFGKQDIIEKFDVIIRNAIEISKRLPRVKDQREGRVFLKAVEKAIAVRKNNGKKTSQGPGMLEHRVSPRLEWLVDMGCLEKASHKRNVFQYRVTTSGTELLTLFEQLFHSSPQVKPYWPEELAVAVWRQRARTTAQDGSSPKEGVNDALRHAYRLIHLPIGPCPIKDVVLIAALFTETNKRVNDLVEQLFALSASSKDVILSGGRYQREPQNVAMTDSVLKVGEVPDEPDG
jgi:hypothetical protein